MARQRLEIPLAIERLGFVVETIQDHGDKWKGLAGLVAVAQGLGDEKPAQATTLMRSADSQPGKHRYRQDATRQLLADLGRQVAEIDLARSQGVIACDRLGI